MPRIFGINDGLVSNLALVMGVAGASQANQLIVLAGVAGLLAGAFSMAAGEYISMQSQRELFERQIELEREELRLMPEVEQAELATLYRAKGLTREEADLVALAPHAGPEHALDTKIREELGLDPSELGSPTGAALVVVRRVRGRCVHPARAVPRRVGYRARWSRRSSSRSARCSRSGPR